jgi:hypothetical protein
VPPCLGCSYLRCPYKNHRCDWGGTGVNYRAIFVYTPLI